ncbi:MAG: VWA domain-containing protein [Deltaproteobacteria bacterium]|nr:VWA domain-containing protein [Deltaproteobacteria bacterium]
MNPYTAPINSSGAEVLTTDGRSLPLLGAKLVAKAKGGIARIVLEQTFANRYDETLHVTYRMPLPADGAVSAYVFEIAGRTITGTVDRKREARERFERAVAEGKTAALLEQNRDDIFTQEIGNLPAGQTLIARITVDQKLAWLSEGEWELRFPTVIGPRYISAPATAATEATERDARDTAIAVAPGGVGASVQIAISIGDRLIAGRKASSPSHKIKRDADGNVELDTEATLDRDIVVRWPVATREVGLSLDVARPGSARDGLARKAEHSYGLLTIVPPARSEGATGVSLLPRDLIILFDTSGSMGGAPLQKAKHVISMLIESLGELDRLEVIEFSMQTRRWKPEPVDATSDAKRDAIKWVRSREAGGGTEMGSAVRDALDALRIGAQRQVVLVTDGYIGNEAQVVRTLHENLPKSCRLHVLGIGSAVNRALATAMARAGRGAEVLVGLDEDIERGAKRLVDRMKAPVLTNVEISGSALVRSAPERVPDVFEGSPVVAALALSPEGGELVVRGELAKGQTGPGHPYRVSSEAWIQRITVSPKRDREPGSDSGRENNPAIVSLYARELVADLETRWTIADDSSAIDREIETVGVEYQIATRMTSWVAIDHDSHVDGPARHEVQPQALPYGTTAESFGLRTAASSFGAAAPMMLGGPMVSASSMAGAPSPMQSMPSAKTMLGLAKKTHAFRLDENRPIPGAPMMRMSSQDTGAFMAPRARRRRLGLVIAAVVLALIAFLVWLVL